MSAGFWAGKRVFMTGHTGFKGSWMCLLLKSLGAKVSGYALQPPTTPSLYELARVGEFVDSTTGDIRELDKLSACVRAAVPQIVLHMAAQSVVLHSYEDPVETYSTNVIGTVNTLEAVRLTKSRCAVINVTSDKCYQNNGWVWGYRESDALGGHDPYSNSKACAELVGQAYRDSFFPAATWAEHGVGLASARAGNVIGGGDWTPRQLIPDVMAAFAKGESVVLRHPEAIRPWQHVLDCLMGYLTLAEAVASDAGRYSGEWNFGPSYIDARPVSYVVDALARRWAIAQPWVRQGGTHLPEATTLKLDVAKATSELDWRPRWPIDAALGAVADWYRGYEAGRDPRDLCQVQIDQFLALA